MGTLGKLARYARRQGSPSAGRTARLQGAQSNVASIFTQKLDVIRALPRWTYPWLKSASPSSPPKKLIASSSSISWGRSTTSTTWRLIQIASPVLALDSNSVTGTNVLDNLLKLARHRIPITPDFNSNLVVRHRTSFRLWPDPQRPQLLAVRSIRCAALLALKEACALTLSDVWTTDLDPVETFCLCSPQARL
jgi:hypothetical protein